MRLEKMAILLILFLILFFSKILYADIVYEETGSSSFAHHDEFSEELEAHYVYLSENNTNQYSTSHHKSHRSHPYSLGLPGKIAPGERVIIVDPNVHAWGAYSASGVLLRTGLATAGSKWCRDLGRPCRTRAGTFRIYSLGSYSCISSKYPLGEGGAPMPYCMYFNGSQGLHGSYEVVPGNISHGCIRLRVRDAEWIRFNFAHIGTKVIVRPY